MNSHYTNRFEGYAHNIKNFKIKNVVMYLSVGYFLLNIESV